MGLQIEDPRNGKTVGVTNSNMIKSSSISANIVHYNNHAVGKTFTMKIDVTPSGANQCFAYMKNTSDDDIVIDSFVLSCPTDENVQVKLGDNGTAAAGTDIVPVNMNAGSGHLADGIFETGVDITGLNGGSTVINLFINGGESSRVFSPSSSIIIPKNKTMTLYAVAGSIALNIGILFSYDSGDF